ncbi:claudin-34 [Scomber scombrus]|uniref:Claudin-34 n=1 Tax=Scomber scombrus TaxID=13677 RepID=A0AAV1NC44_SCOSC
MIYLANTAHCQFLGLMVGFLAWILIMTTNGMNEWRLWYVTDKSVITSGVAWVGIWRVCFYSHTLPKFENCQWISISDTFVPAEISVAQVLMLLAVICGLAGNISAALAMRIVYFSVEDRRNIRLAFVLAGTLYVFTAVLCLVPLGWNMSSVLNNSTIDFPPEFYLPEAPASQQVGTAIGVGMLASIMMLICGLVFLCYQYVWQTLSSEAPRDTRDLLNGTWTETTLSQKSELPNGNQGIDNPGFQNEEVS